MWPYIQAQGDAICFEVYKTGKNLQTKYEALYVSDGGLTLEEYNAIMRGAKDFVDVFSIEQLFDSREVVLKKAGGEKRGEGA
jgi:hypothetical protein